MPFPDYLTKLGIIPGIKVDTGAKPLAGFPDETITEGLDGLRERLLEYYKLGARFAKWRAVIDIGEGIPTRGAIEANAHALARYAALCQEQNIVPIVEPEVLMDGATRIERCEEVTDAVLAEVFAQLRSPAHPSGRHDPQAQHGDLGQEVPDAGHAGAGRRRHRALPQAPRAGGRARHHVPVGRPVAGRGDAAPVADESSSGRCPGSCPSAMAARCRMRR